MEKSILQSKAWQKFQEDLGKKVIFRDEKGFSLLLIEENTKLGKYFFLPYGPFIKDKKSAKTAFNLVTKIASENQAFFVRIEPQDKKTAEYWLKQKNCKKSKDIDPARTWQIDLSQDKDKILSDMKSNNRNIWRNYAKKGVRIELSKDPGDIKHLISLQKAIAKRNNIIQPDEKYLKKQIAQDFSALYLAYLEDKVIAAALCFDDKTTRYYMQAAADDQYRKLSAGTALLAQMIFDAKAKGLKSFDFWGIAPENADKSHPWAGFTRFKQSFGGFPVDYAGTYDIVLNPLRYNLYQILRKINRLIRKVTH